MNLPIGWELRELKEHPGRAYYYNKITHDSTWIRPIPYPGLQTNWPPLVSVKYILIRHKELPNDGSTRSKNKNLTREQAKQKIENIFNEITQGKTFEDLAREESDVIPHHKNWDIGWISKGSLDKKFEDVAWNLGIGELSSPVETDYGWQIILRNG